ncbi:MAG: 3-phosphoshikimate 1-carboxyvinyltransferase [Anaerolineae bacterium]|nr:3-phosphoshikimate 1-carboxyvinyltransferase [Anaerolineae bacterium]
MKQLTVRPSGPLRGSVRIPGDKSISHRALLLSALAEGASHIENFLPSGDCKATLGCLRLLGVHIEQHDATTLTVHGHGKYGLQPPASPLDCVRSGTTMRLLCGILAGQPFQSILTGDLQLLRRPMRRVVEPLRRMGAEITDTEGYAPLSISGRQLHGYDHALEIASAQVKSALLLAGLYADSPTTVREPAPSRDHTERMLSAMGARLTINGLSTTIIPDTTPLRPLSLVIPGDISSAAFPLVAALLVSGSEVTVEGVGVNPTRTGLLDVLREMGAEVAVSNARALGGEPVADLTARTSGLRGVEIGGATVVRMIDEFPVLAVAATQAEGRTIVRDAAELRVKETDRIATVVMELGKLGAQIEPLPDGFIVSGPTPLQGTAVSSHGDHRLAMALFVAGLVAAGETTIEDMDCVSDSFPGFVELMYSLTAAVDGHP